MLSTLPQGPIEIRGGTFEPPAPSVPPWCPAKIRPDPHRTSNVIRTSTVIRRAVSGKLSLPVTLSSLSVNRGRPLILLPWLK